MHKHYKYVYIYWLEYGKQRTRFIFNAVLLFRRYFGILVHTSIALIMIERNSFFFLLLFAIPIQYLICNIVTGNCRLMAALIAITMYSLLFSTHFQSYRSINPFIHCPKIIRTLHIQYPYQRFFWGLSKILKKAVPLTNDAKKNQKKHKAIPIHQRFDDCVILSRLMKTLLISPFHSVQVCAFTHFRCFCCYILSFLFYHLSSLMYLATLSTQPPVVCVIFKESN